MANKKAEPNRRLQKEKLDADIEAFLKKGGAIEKIPSASEQYETVRQHKKAVASGI